MEALNNALGRRAVAQRPQSVLFACSENAIRSPIAEALARRRVGRAVHIESVGVRPGQRNGFVTAVMDEVGIDLSRHQPRVFEDLDDDSFDLVVTLSPEAHHRALEFTRNSAAVVNYWPTFDPTAVEGSRDAVLRAFRAVREALVRRIEAELRRPGAGSE